jgi:NADPH:quinone reductase-like Zn-dependent oxidoreductase
MKAIVVHQYGPPEVLRFGEYPDPAPSVVQVLVRVAAATCPDSVPYARHPVDVLNWAGPSDWL